MCVCSVHEAASAIAVRDWCKEPRYMGVFVMKARSSEHHKITIY